PRRGPVHEVQVDAVEAELLEALLDGAVGVTVAVVPQFGGDEELVAGDGGCGQCSADAFLVAVDGCGVDVPVAELEGVADDALGFGRVDFEHPEAELGDDLAVVESHKLHGTSLRRAYCGGMK